jgi:hypothetical protein
MRGFPEEEKTIDINCRSVKFRGRRDTDTGCKHAERKELVCKDNIKYTGRSNWSLWAIDKY